MLFLNILAIFSAFSFAHDGGTIPHEASVAKRLCELALRTKNLTISRPHSPQWEMHFGEGFAWIRSLHVIEVIKNVPGSGINHGNRFMVIHAGVSRFQHHGENYDRLNYLLAIHWPEGIESREALPDGQVFKLDRSNVKSFKLVGEFKEHPDVID